MRPTAWIVREIGESFSKDKCVRVSLVVVQIGPQQVTLAKDNHVINAFPPDRPDQPLRTSILPRRPRGCGSISDAHGANAPNKHLTIGSIAVTGRI